LRGGKKKDLGPTVPEQREKKETGSTRKEKAPNSFSRKGGGEDLFASTREKGEVHRGGTALHCSTTTGEGKKEKSSMWVFIRKKERSTRKVVGGETPLVGKKRKRERGGRVTKRKKKSPCKEGKGSPLITSRRRGKGGKANKKRAYLNF